MSYADVTAANSAPLSEQPRPDPALLNTTPPSASNIVDETKKVNIVSQEYKTNPATTTSERNVFYPEANHSSGYENWNAERRRRSEEAGKRDKYRHISPAMTVGMVGLVNAAVLGTIGYISYVNWNRPAWGRRTISTAVVGILTLCGDAYFMNWHQDGRLLK